MLTRLLPFRLDDAYGGFAEVKGQLRLENDGVALEFQVKDSVFGALKSGVKELFLPITELDDVQFKDGFFLRRLTLCTRSMAALADLPGADGPRVVLKIAKADAKTARVISSHLAMTLSEERLRRLEEEARQA